MRRSVASFAVAAALVVAVVPQSAWAQAGNVGGTIGKTDKIKAGSDQPRKKPTRKTHARPATPGPGGCRTVVGNWTWLWGLTARFSADRSVRFPGLSGKWSCTGSTLVIKWDHGVTDRGTFSADGTTVSVVTSRGRSFQGKHK